jgi:hypothetical protein
MGVLSLEINGTAEFGLKLSVYHPELFTELNKMGFTSQTHLYLYLMYIKY